MDLPPSQRLYLCPVYSPGFYEVLRVMTKCDGPKNLYKANTELIKHIVALEEKLPDKVVLENALKESEMRYRRLFETAKDGILILDADSGIVVDVNPFLLGLIGYPYDEIHGKFLWEIGIFKDIAASKEKFRSLCENEYIRYENLPLQKSDGTIADVEFVSNVYLVDGKKVIQCNIRDITARKLATDELKRNETRLRVIVDILQHQSDTIQEFIDYALEQAIVVTASSIGYIYHYDENREQFTLNSCSKEVMAQCSVANPPKVYDLVNTGVWGEAVRQRKPIVVNEFKSQDSLLKGQPEEHFHLTKFMTVPIFKNARIVGVIGLGNKKTDYTQTDVLQASLLIEAVWKVVERMEAEAEKVVILTQLNQAQKMEAVGRLAGGVAHDFNNLLTIINGLAEIAASEVSPLDPILQRFEGILEAGKRAANLTRQLLAFARKEVVCPRDLNLNEAVDGIEKMLKRLINEDINLVWHPGKDVWHVHLDPSQFDQVIANLVVNARDAIPGTGTITIETGNAVLDEAYCALHVGAKPGEYAVLTVTDSGVGMEQPILSHLFEPFFTTKEPGKGTGLGLATVYGIVKQAEGSINVYSEPGQGTTFRAYFPRWKGGPTASVVRDDSPKLLRGTETVLLVEDEERVLEIGTVILRSFGYKVMAFQLPGEAIRAAGEATQAIDLLATDVVMPGMNGRELYEQLKATHPEMKCLFLSGYTADVITERGVLPEGVNFLHKPYSVKGLAAKVRAVLNATQDLTAKGASTQLPMCLNTPE